MCNLIQNSRFCPNGSCNEPKFFTLNDFSYDDLSCNGNRTCSLTRNASQRNDSFIEYDLPIRTNCKKCLTCGCTCRCVSADNCELVLDCYDGNGCLIKSLSSNCAGAIGPNFAPISNTFRLPSNTTECDFSIRCCGDVTALTCYRPFCF